MNATLLGNATLPAFLLASLILAATPGPGVLYIVARTLTQGRRAGLSSVAGVALGNLASACAASIGLAALFAVSSLAFAVVKYAGAAYLIYLGVKTLRRGAVESSAAFGAADLAAIFRDGFLVALLNPKTALFFAAFLPQFVEPVQGNIPLQMLALGLLFLGMATITNSVYAFVAGAAGRWLRGNQKFARVQQYVAGTVYIGLGVTAAMVSGRQR